MKYGDFMIHSLHHINHINNEAIGSESSLSPMEVEESHKTLVHGKQQAHLIWRTECEQPRNVQTF
jgi:hypothetical protein